MAARKLNPDEQRRAQVFARFTYAGIMLAFITICTVAVITTMNAEKNKTGFKPIRVKQPISFIDKTYLDPASGRRVEKPDPEKANETRP